MARQVFIFDRLQEVLKITTGMFRELEFLSACNTSNPLTPGIFKSRKMRSGCGGGFNTLLMRSIPLL